MTAVIAGKRWTITRLLFWWWCAAMLGNEKSRLFIAGVISENNATLLRMVDQETARLERNNRR